MANNCSECVFKNYALANYSVITPEMVAINERSYVQCLNGNTEKAVDFYKRNINVPSQDVKDEFDCFTKTKIAEKLDNLIVMADNLLKNVKK